MLQPDTATAPRTPRIVTIARTPLRIEAGWQQQTTISEKWKSKYFSPTIWTWVIGLDARTKSVFWRTIPVWMMGYNASPAGGRARTEWMPV
jgi:hypothetical protein